MGKMGKITAREVALCGVMIAVIEVCKGVMAGIPNIELTSFWIIMFTTFYGKLMWFVIPAFVLIEAFLYGINIWVVSYIYVWPILAVLTWFVKKHASAVNYSLLSGGYGLVFGFLSVLPTIVIGTSEGGIMNGLRVAFTWWVAGIPWDVVHCIGNFVLMLVLYKPVHSVLMRVKEDLR